MLSDNLSDNVMVYGQLSTGYKAGGVNARPFFPSQTHAFDPETHSSYRGRHQEHVQADVRLNAALFYNDYKDIQLPLTNCYWAPPAQQVRARAKTTRAARMSAASRSRPSGTHGSILARRVV